MSDPLLDALADLTALRDRDALDAAFVRILGERFDPCSVGLFRLVDVGETQRVHAAAWRSSGGRVTVAPPPDAADALAGLDAIPEAAAALRDARAACVPGPGVDRWLFPIHAADRPLGWAEIELPCGLATPPGGEASAVARFYANHVALLDDGQRDALTGLMNRRSFDDAFYAALVGGGRRPPRPDGLERRRAAVGGPPAWLAVVDIDHFKRVNDAWGHLYGDEVLVALARTMRLSFRGGDRLFRFGGEEFVVLMQSMSDQDVGPVLERFRRGVAAREFPKVGHVTVSIGYTRVRHDDTPTAAFDRADAALYFAKQSGRDRICEHAALVADGALGERGASGEFELF